MGQLLWKTVWQLFKKASVHFTYGPSIATIYPKEKRVHVSLCPQMFPAAFFTDTRSGETLRTRQLGDGERKCGLTL